MTDVVSGGRRTPLDQLDRNEEADVLCVTFGSSITDRFENPVWFKVGQSGTKVGYLHMTMMRPAADSPNVAVPTC